jgi:hypothetical protein
MNLTPEAKQDKAALLDGAKQFSIDGIPDSNLPMPWDLLDPNWKSMPKTQQTSLMARIPLGLRVMMKITSDIAGVRNNPELISRAMQAYVRELQAEKPERFYNTIRDLLTNEDILVNYLPESHQNEEGAELVRKALADFL